MIGAIIFIVVPIVLASFPAFYAFAMRRWVLALVLLGGGVLALGLPVYLFVQKAEGAVAAGADVPGILILPFVPLVCAGAYGGLGTLIAAFAGERRRAV